MAHLRTYYIMYSIVYIKFTDLAIKQNSVPQMEVARSISRGGGAATGVDGEHAVQSD